MIHGPYSASQFRNCSPHYALNSTSSDPILTSFNIGLLENHHQPFQSLQSEKFLKSDSVYCCVSFQEYYFGTVETKHWSKNHVCGFLGQVIFVKLYWFRLYLRNINFSDHAKYWIIISWLFLIFFSSGSKSFRTDLDLTVR